MSNDDTTRDEVQSGLIASLLPFFSKYGVELILILIAFSITVYSSLLYISTSEPEEVDMESATEYTIPEYSITHPIQVELSGAIDQPDVYEVTPGARLKELIQLAGGLSDDADTAYFSRNFNLARMVADQDKYHIPSRQEIALGLYTESFLQSNYLQKQSVSTSDEQTVRMSINTALLEELDRLPGIGKVTAQKIIENRPYSSLEDLTSKKILTKTVFDRIKSLIQL